MDDPHPMAQPGSGAELVYTMLALEGVETMTPVRSFEPITAQAINSIAAALGHIGSMIAGIGEVDISAGAGIINDNTKCLWTKDGHRIEVWLSSDGGFGASKSKNIDPNKPKPAA